MICPEWAPICRTTRRPWSAGRRPRGDVARDFTPDNERLYVDMRRGPLTSSMGEAVAFLRCGDELLWLLYLAAVRLGRHGGHGRGCCGWSGCWGGCRPAPARAERGWSPTHHVVSARCSPLRGKPQPRPHDVRHSHLALARHRPHPAHPGHAPPSWHRCSVCMSSPPSNGVAARQPTGPPASRRAGDPRSRRPPPAC